MPDSILFVGGGQMAGALIGGLLAAGRAPSRLHAIEPDAARAQFLRDTHGVSVHATAEGLRVDAATVVVAVKPQTMAAALKPLRLAPATTVVSIAAGVRIAALKHWLGNGVHVVRAMPNTPAQLRAGISALFAPPSVPAAARAAAEAVLAAGGQTLWVAREELLDAVTALSGSGPAYYFLLTEVLRESGMALGLNEADATRLARQTFVGAARMAEASPLELATLRANVTSKGGTTEAAVKRLEEGGLRPLFRLAVAAAERRGRELGDALAKEAAA